MVRARSVAARVLNVARVMRIPMAHGSIAHRVIKQINPILASSGGGIFLFAISCLRELLLIFLCLFGFLGFFEHRLSGFALGTDLLALVFGRDIEIVSPYKTDTLNGIGLP